MDLPLSSICISFLLSILLDPFSFHSERRNKNKVMDVSENRVTDSRCIRHLPEDVGENREQETRYHLDRIRSPLNCATRLNLHYPIVGTALPFSVLVSRPSFADRCTMIKMKI